MSRNKVALVTGAGRGIGRAIALRLARDQVNILAAARSTEELDRLAVEIGELGGVCRTFSCDLSDRRQVEGLIQVGLEEKANILINNAGIGSSQKPAPVVEFDDAFWDRTLEVNVTVPYRLTKALLPTMLENLWGRIVNVASINAKVPALHGAAYTASKHALAGLTKTVALEVAGTGVTANAVCPGVTATAMNDLRIQYDAERLNQSTENVEQNATPLGRRLTPDEIAPLAAFLISDDARAINGQMLNVCGGTVMAC